MKFDIRRRREGLFKQRKPRGPLLPISIVILLGMLALFALITPPGSFPNINPANVVVPTFTPTTTPIPTPTDVHGGHIVFTCTRKDINQICLIRSDGTRYQQLTNVTTNAYYPAISPDGQTILFALSQYDNFNINEMRLSDLQYFQISVSVGNSFSPDYSPDGKQVVFVNRVGKAPSALWLMGGDGQDPHELYAGPKDIVGASWSPDGSWIAFTMQVDSAFTYEVFLLDARHPQAPPRRISHGLTGIGGSLDWSPNGKSLAIFAGPVEAREIYQLDVTDGAFTQLTFGGNNAAASYSPDGQYIIYNSLRNNGQADLYIMRADGHSTRQLTDNAEPDWQPVWGP
jgi:Tol biopolymer transport system component